MERWPLRPRCDRRSSVHFLLLSEIDIASLRRRSYRSLLSLYVRGPLVPGGVVPVPVPLRVAVGLAVRNTNYGGHNAKSSSSLVWGWCIALEIACKHGGGMLWVSGGSEDQCVTWLELLKMRNPKIRVHLVMGILTCFMFGHEAKPIRHGAEQTLGQRHPVPGVGRRHQRFQIVPASVGGRPVVDVLQYHYSGCAPEKHNR